MKQFEAIVTTINGSHRLNIFGRATSSQAARFIFSIMKRANITHIVIYPYKNNRRYEIDTAN